MDIGFNRAEEYAAAQALYRDKQVY